MYIILLLLIVLFLLTGFFILTFIGHSPLFRRLIGGIWYKISVPMDEGSFKYWTNKKPKTFKYLVKCEVYKRIIKKEILSHEEIENLAVKANMKGWEHLFKNGDIPQKPYPPIYKCVLDVWIDGYVTKEKELY